ncbi:hypothetical protein [Rhodopirellula sp. MGV]|uniref:hypothetical protein n=1 Tax=Rhodopirellula sp. MGV TaxID=2023130 RepID=UPI000B974F13|nr:hypothetical protein [Rhodopirellula sp. MGV]OYP33092.1 hypothetical protein CGZ80_18560 [Rhodopirellula sp. MGV]PNY37955.1 hypothetical protein C2E31_05500 [Rhodopirellula baltica]
MNLESSSKRYLYAVAIACLVSMASTQNAFASCGDWLAVDHSASVANEVPAGDFHIASPIEPIPRCDGPTCRSQDRQPVPAPATTDVWKLRTDVVIAGLSLATPESEPRCLMEWQNAMALAGYPIAVEHPPRG